MAGSWIKMTHELPEKPEVLAISGKTGLNRFDVVGRLFILWRWFDNNTTDGNAVGVTSVTLEECLFGYGSNVGFVSAVVAARWLIETPDGIRVVKFDEHISESAKTRAQTAKRVAKSKEKSKAYNNKQEDQDGNGTGNGESVTKTVPRERERRDISKPPLSPKGEKSGRKKSPQISLQAFLDDCKSKNERPVRDYQPLWDYVKSAKLPHDYVVLAWAEFCRQFGPEGTNETKRQVDWRKTFRTYVEKNYLKLWAIGQDGEYFLTSQGKQADKFHESKASA